MNTQDALVLATQTPPAPEELEAFSSFLDGYENLVGQEEYEMAPLTAYRFFLAGRLFQEDQDAENLTVNINLTPEQASNLIAGLLGD